MQKRKFVFLSKWNRHDLTCACLQMKPCCNEFKNCEELELELKPYDDLEEVMRAHRYKRGKGGSVKQIE